MGGVAKQPEHQVRCFAPLANSHGDEQLRFEIDGKEKGVYRDDPVVMAKQIKRFKQEGYPENNGLITAPILIRKHFDNEVTKVMEAWWNIVNTESKRDQLSFNYVAWKLNFINFTYIDGSVRSGNPWFYTISHRKKYAFKMFKIKFKKFFKSKNN